MNFPLLVARRYLISRKSQNVINIISLISIIGLSVGTAALIIVLSVFNGFDELIKSLFNTFDPDIQICLNEGKSFSVENESFEKIKNLEEVIYYSDVVEENVLLKYGDKYHPAQMKGVADDYFKMSGIDSMITEGEFLLKKGDQQYALIGQGIAYYLSVGLTFVTPLQVYVPRKGTHISLNLNNAFSRKIIYPSGIYAIQQEYDSKVFLVPLDFARALVQNENEVTSFELKISEKYTVTEVQEKIEQTLGDKFVVKDRYQQHELLYKIMRSEKWAIFLILTFILIIASFNVVGSLTMLIIEKQNDISILQSMGADYKLVRKIFLFEGWLISFAGAIIGIIIGFLVCFLQQKFGFVSLDTSGNFVVDAYPVQMLIKDFVIVFITVLFVGFLAAWFPVQYISKRFTSSFTI